MSEVLPIDPQFEELISWVCAHNRSAPAADRVLVNLDSGHAAPATVRNRGADVGRNDPCPCGSGVKWKRCCGCK